MTDALWTRSSGYDILMRRWAMRVMIEARVMLPPGVWESATIEETEYDFGNRGCWVFRAMTTWGEPIVREERRLSGWLRLVLG
mgnify:CR=1 FL=1